MTFESEAERGRADQWDQVGDRRMLRYALGGRPDAFEAFTQPQRAQRSSPDREAFLSLEPSTRSGLSAFSG
jgi:hypothetical protein